MHDLLDDVPDLLEEYAVPGVAIGIRTTRDDQDDPLEIVAGFGVTNVEHPLPVTGDTIFQVGSISKTLLGLVIGRLVDRGQVELDAPVHPLFPDHEIDPRITLRHTITHTSGIDAQNMIADAPTLLADHADDSIQASLQHFLHRPLLFEPGTDFSYSGPGIMVAAAVVERVTGRPYVDVLRDEVLAPAGMSTTFTSADEVVARRVAGPHDRGADGRPVLLIDGGWQQHWQLPGWDVPGGGVLSTVSDLLSYSDYVRTSDRPSQLFQPLASQGMQGHDIGLAWHLDPVGDELAVSHSGLTIGYATRLVLIPSIGLTFTILTNSLQGGALVSEIEARILDRVVGSAAQPRVGPVPDDLQAALTGTYDCGFYGTMTVSPGERTGELRMVPTAATVEPGQYVIDLHGADRLALGGPDTLIVLSPDGTPGDEIGFVRESDGSVSAIRFHGRLDRRLP